MQCDLNTNIYCCCTFLLSTIFVLNALSIFSNMDAKLIFPFKTLFTPQIHHRICMHKPKHFAPFKRAVMAEPAENAELPTIISSSKNVYNDGWFDLLAINHLSQSLQATTGLRSKKSGYDGLVVTATAASMIFSPSQQRQVVIQTLEKAFPRPILSLIRMLLPQSKFAREYFAAFTTVFFAWLVGSCEVRESEIDGKREKNVVYIKKCRFLEGTNCVGMCTNLCKFPSQVFIKDSLGMPLNMVPNFDDMSCEMIFGQEPPSPSNDPAFSQPCYKLCKANKGHHENCTS